ncbi:MAG TPA: PGPGW domain-containing protein [Pirellulales bacterium]|nr:PGPGW domain-containing protein [Pirellulales bacterium]
MSVFASFSADSIEWLNQLRRHAALGWWLLGLSLVLSVGGFFLMRRLLVAMPADYFVRTSPLPWQLRHPVVRWTLLVAKNLLGAVLLVVGLVMLAAPGPGILTLLAALVLLDIPGKRALEQRFLAVPAVLHTINRLRQRANRPPLQMPEH